MSGATVADLLADLLGPAADPGAIPAKAANPANREHWRGFPADSQAANGLRISANPEPLATEAAPDSQTFAADSQGTNPPDRKQWRGFSQDSQDSQGATRAKASPDPWQKRTEPVSRPYRLPQAAGDAAHADPWDDATIARFQARVTTIRRRGFTEEDADDLAERLHLRDVHADHRALCLECRHLAGSVTGWRCGNHRAADVARDLPAAQVTMPQDCPGFTAAAADTDRARNLQ